MGEPTEEQIAALLRLLAPAPEGWIAVACEIPQRELRGSEEVGSSSRREEERDG
jgi:hypothetical protein